MMPSVKDIKSALSAWEAAADAPFEDAEHEAANDMADVLRAIVADFEESVYGKRPLASLKGARERLGREEPLNWTVIGFWLDDEPVVAGAVAGDAAVFLNSDLGGYSALQGGWADTVKATDADMAEQYAVAKMRATLDPDSEDEPQDPYDPTTDDGTVAHDGLTLPSYGD